MENNNSCSSKQEYQSEKLIISTGYHERGTADINMAIHWLNNTRKAYAGKIIVLTTGARFPVKDANLTEIRGENLGHVGDLINGSKEGPICGWSASVIALAMIAYNFNADLFYKENDALGFGSWLLQAYTDLGDGDMVFGGKMETFPYMQSAQSLFIIRHKFILNFIRQYLSLPPDKDMLPEEKFSKLEGDIKFLSFGCDRERPIPWDDPVYYVQQWTPVELEEAKQRGIL